MLGEKKKEEMDEAMQESIRTSPRWIERVAPDQNDTISKARWKLTP